MIIKKYRKLLLVCFVVVILIGVAAFSFMSGRENSQGDEVNKLELFVRFDCIECVEVYQDLLSISNQSKPETTLELFFIGTESLEYNKLVGLFSAEKQNKYSQFLDNVFTKGSNEPILEIAKDIGLNLTIFEEDINSEEMNNKAQAMIAVADERGITSTPTVILNNRIITFQNLEELDQIILGDG